MCSFAKHHLCSLAGQFNVSFLFCFRRLFSIKYGTLFRLKSHSLFKNKRYKRNTNKTVCVLKHIRVEQPMYAVRRSCRVRDEKQRLIINREAFFLRQHQSAMVARSSCLTAQPDSLVIKFIYIHSHIYTSCCLTPTRIAIIVVYYS